MHKLFKIPNTLNSKNNYSVLCYQLVLKKTYCLYMALLTINT